MKSYKCSKREVHRVFAKVLRNAPAKIQRKKTKEDKEGETGGRCDYEENLTDIENLCNLCLLFSCEKS